MDKKVAELKDRLNEALKLRNKKSADLVRDLDIPKSAMSYYRSGRSQNMTSDRLHEICKYLDVSEAWMMGYDVPMDRMTHKKNDTISDAVVEMRTDSDFYEIVEDILSMDKTKRVAVKSFLHAFLDNHDDQI